MQVRAAHRRTCLFGLGPDLEPARKCAASGSSQREQQQETEETESRGKGGVFGRGRGQSMTGSKRALFVRNYKTAQDHEPGETLTTTMVKSV